LIALEVGWEGILNHWLLGDYGGQVKHFGDLGSYIHNILSYWRQYGIVPFVLIIALLWVLSKNIFLVKAHRYPRYMSDIYFFKMVSVFLVVEGLVARAYSSPFLWLAVGIMLRMMVIEQAERRTTEIGDCVEK